jgi:hypothetical protein
MYTCVEQPFDGLVQAQTHTGEEELEPERSTSNDASVHSPQDNTCHALNQTLRSCSNLGDIASCCMRIHVVQYLPMQARAEALERCPHPFLLDNFDYGLKWATIFWRQVHTLVCAVNQSLQLQPHL